MKKFNLAIFVIILCVHQGLAQPQSGGLKGDPEAIADARAMVETMGGMTIWAKLKSVHFVHRWDPWYRVDSYIEDEILDLTGPRSWVKMESEINHRIRAYSPEHGYWSITNGKFSTGTAETLSNALKRAPFHFCRIARAVAINDPRYEIRFGSGDIAHTRRLEFYGPDGTLGGWIILNARKEPIFWATTQYRYIFGPLKRFGNLRVPDWAVYENGITRYEMISLKGSDQALDPDRFKPYKRFDTGENKRN